MVSANILFQVLGYGKDTMRTSYGIVETKRRRVGGMNSLYFPLRHHMYIYKKARLYIK